MTKFESKITLISILVGVIGSAATIYSLVKPESKETQSITFISNLTATSTSGSTIKPPITPVIPAVTKPITHDYSSEVIKGDAHLVISATGADITILEGDPKFPYQGGVVSSTGSEQIIYLPKGQRLSVDLSGTGAELEIARSVARQVSVNNSGVGADVSVF